jgi:hypothetical protein
MVPDCRSPLGERLEKARSPVHHRHRHFALPGKFDLAWWSDRGVFIISFVPTTTD